MNALPDLFGQPAAHDPGGKARVRWPDGSTISAEFSPCGRYRWSLSEIWDPAGPLWLWLMMNPSVAGLECSDMTVQKTGRIARLGGAGGQLIGNTGAYRSTSPAGLSDVDDPIGPENEQAILAMARRAGKIVVAYGQPPKPLAGEGLRLARLLAAESFELHVLRLSRDGTPMHPLSRGKGFIPVSITPVRWSPP